MEKKDRDIDSPGSFDVFDDIWVGEIKGKNKKEFPISMSTAKQVESFIEKRSEYLDDLFSNAPGRSILNCGCGTGQWSIPFVKKGYYVVNFDRSKNALLLSQKNFSEESMDGTFIRGDVLNLNFKDRSFDIVMSFGLLEHFKEVQPIVSEMVRVLKPGGIFLADIVTKRLSVRTFENLYSLFCCVFGKGLRFKITELGECTQFIKPPYYENSCSPGDYKGFMKAARLEDIGINSVRDFPFVALPRKFDSVYASILKSFPRKVDSNESDSALHLAWSAVWEAYGVKR